MWDDSVDDHEFGPVLTPSRLGPCPLEPPAPYCEVPDCDGLEPDNVFYDEEEEDIAEMLMALEEALSHSKKAPPAKCASPPDSPKTAICPEKDINDVLDGLLGLSLLAVAVVCSGWLAKKFSPTSMLKVDS
mmetsp:Transcript_34779/g.74001  ORF Transcript_34779/g.74001 Transcript_34779/m.74001 type:complete len:131 (-) Transcript_34779:169-561(-)